MKFRNHLIVFILCLTALVIPAGAQEPYDPQPEPLAASDVDRVAFLDGPAAEQDIVNRTNALRSSNGLGTLTVNNCLMLSARRHGQDMGQRNYFEHQAPAPAPYGVNFSERASAAGYTGFARAENIAAGYTSGQAVYDGWTTSSGHLDNMLLADATEIGVGYAAVSGSNYFHYWTMVLGKNSTSDCSMTSTNIPTTAMPTGLSVSGNTSVYPARPTFNWTYTAGSDQVAPTWFRVVAVLNGTTKLSQWISAADACGGDATCSYTPDAVKLPDGLKPQGIYDFWVAGHSPNGTVWSGKHSFSVTSGAGLVSMVSPTQDAMVNTALVSLTWNNDPKAQWYRVLLNGPDGYKLDQWVSAADVCSGETCTFVASPAKIGSYQWWMIAWGPGGMSYGGQYNGYVTRSYALSVQMPAVSNIQTDVSTAYTRVSWTYDTNASWYQLQITNDGSGAVAHNKWYRSDAICFNSQCAVGSLPIVNGSYTVVVRGWGPAGMSNEAATTMQVSHIAPDLAGDFRSPVNGASSVSGANLTLEWANNARTLWYQVILNGPNGGVINKWYESRSVCPGSTCGLGPLNLPSGGYQWTLKGWGPGGTGSPVTTSFTVSN